MICDICGASGIGTIVPARQMSNAVRKGFNPFNNGCLPEAMVRMASPGFPDQWAQSAISGDTSQSDWNLCSSCMSKFSGYLNTASASGMAITSRKHEQSPKKEQPPDPSLLINAVKNNSIQDVRDLIAKGADVNAKANDGGTALMYAAGMGYTDCVLELIKTGADVNSRYGNGMTPLMYASKDNHADIVHYLLKADAKVDAEDDIGWTALNKAAGKGHSACVDALLAAGANPNTKDKDGQTALMSAGQEGYTYIVAELLKKGAKVNEKDNKGGTALMYAVEPGHADCVQELLSNGADINTKSSSGWTALMIASKLGRTECVRLLNSPPIKKKDEPVKKVKKPWYKFW